MRARQAQEEEFARQKQITDLLAGVFSALDSRAAADIAVGKALVSLRQIGEPVSAIARKTGLTTREVNNLIALTETEDEEPTTTSPTQEDTDKQTPRTPGAAVEISIAESPTSRE
jgi:hypothetical protein